MKIMTIDERNVDHEHICCALGTDKQNQGRAESKKSWMKSQFKNGLTFKRLDVRGKIFIEYIPIEKVWKPLAGSNYLVINCLWVSGRFKGKGIAKRLLDECINDAKGQKKDGIAVVTSARVKPFLTDKKFFVKHGFHTVETAPPYFELMALKFNNKAVNPAFSNHAKKGICGNQKGFTFIYSNQCPFMDDYVGFLSGYLERKGFFCGTRKLSSYKEAQNTGSPFGTLGIYYNGEFLTHELMLEKKFENFIGFVLKTQRRPHSA